MMEDEGTCVNGTGYEIKPEQICKEDGDCASGSCKRDAKEAGEWLTNGAGPAFTGDLTDCSKDDTVLDGTMITTKKTEAACKVAYFCGFEDSAVGSAKEKMLANGGTVWNVKPLACQGLMCQTRWTEEYYTIRTAAVGDENMDNAVDAFDYRCLYFPAGVANNIPKMAPQAATKDGLWLGSGTSADADGNGDPECGIALIDDTAEQQNARFNTGGNKNVLGGTELVNEENKPTQEKELLINKQAAFR